VVLKKEEKTIGAEMANPDNGEYIEREGQRLN
jgi:hypothetical protein